MEWDSSASERKAEARTMPQSTSVNFCFSFGSSVTISQSRRLVSIPVARRMRQRAEIISATRSCSSRVTGLYMSLYFSTIRSKSRGLASKDLGAAGGAAVAERIAGGLFLPLGGLGAMRLGAVDPALSDCRSVVINTSCHECKPHKSGNWPLFVVYCLN